MGDIVIDSGLNIELYDDLTSKTVNQRGIRLASLRSQYYADTVRIGFDAYNLFDLWFSIVYLVERGFI
jgi:hypothetical protein